MTKHRLMLSAAAAALLAQPLLARADTTISSNTQSSIDTTTDGNITISDSGSVSVKSTTAAVTLNSNNSVLNQGGISNIDTSGAIGFQIDTTAGNIVAPVGGFANFNGISATGDGSGKAALLVTGGNTYFGAFTLGNLVAATTTGTASNQIVSGSQISVQGDNSSAFYLVQGTKMDGDVTFAGGISASGSTKSPNNAGDTLIVFDGVVNGNVVFDATTAANNLGALTEGVALLGGIHSCASDAAAESAAGYTCSTASSASGLGAFVNQGSIATIGTTFPSPKYVNSESGSAFIIANGIDGGFVNDGPGTADTTTATAVISSNGTASNPTFVIDPSRSVTANQTTIRGPINIGPVSAAIDSIDPGYSFINRGSIFAQPIDSQISAVAMSILGSSTANYTCLGTGNFATCAGGGLLNTGTIRAAASTNQQTNTISNGSTQTVTANALIVGAYAAIPRLDILAETATGNSFTPGTITATVSGSGQGYATAIAIAEGASLPIINIGQHASVIANVSTNTISPTSDIASTSAPFALVSEAIVDASSTLKTINNAGTITAATTQLTPAINAVTITSTRAIDLSSSNTSGITVNNSGTILGDVLFGAAGNGDTLNVGNTGTGGAVNGATNVLDTPNNYAVVAARIDGQLSGQPPITETNTINFGSGANQLLHVGGFGYVNSVILANAGSLAVQVDTNGTLFVANTASTGSLNASTFDINGGTLGLTISQNTTATTPVVKAGTEATISPTAAIGLQFGSFVSSGTTAVSVANPTPQNIILISAPTINISATTLANDNAALAENIPFLFQANSKPLSLGNTDGNQTLVLSLTPRVPGAGTTAIPGLGLSGDALAQFPYSAAALANDPLLGAAIASNLTIYNTNNTPASGINIAASQQKAQQVFSQFGPDVSGGAKQVAIMLTDQATGPVAARQRLLHDFSDKPGDLSLWGQEFSGMINNKGRVDADGSLTNYKDHGFGFALGMDAGSPQGGWYGGAFTFYSGDVSQSLPRNSITHTQWYMLTGYTEWRGRHLFLDTQGSLAYGDLLGHRDLVIGNQDREALGKRAGLMGALGANLGAAFHFGGLEMLPHLSLDGLSLREEGYTETGGGDGFNLAVAPYYANSLRGALGTDFKTNFNIWNFTITPDARVGYRYDMVNSPVKLRAGFASTGGLGTVGNSFTFVGPDPDTGNIFGGLSLGASTDNWQVGVNYDMLRGNNGSTTQVGTITLLGRI